VHGNAAELGAKDLRLADVQAGADLDAERLYLAGDGRRTSDGVRRLVESREEPIPGAVNLPPVEAPQRSSNDLVVTGQELSPPTIS
jgi:hypothetical protein